MNKGGRAKKQVRYEDEQMMASFTGRSRSLNQPAALSYFNYSSSSTNAPNKSIDNKINNSQMKSIGAIGVSKSVGHPKKSTKNQNTQQDFKKASHPMISRKPSQKESNYSDEKKPTTQTSNSITKSILVGKSNSTEGHKTSRTATAAKSIIKASDKLSTKDGISIKATKESNISNLGIARKSMSVAEAAARLSFPWPALADEKERKIVEVSPTPPAIPPFDKMNSSFVQEMKTFLDSHQENAKKSKRDAWNPMSRDRGELDDSLDSIMESVKLAYMQSKQMKMGGVGGQQNKRRGTPKWHEVETNWPGFDGKPLDNWMSYAIPPKDQDLLEEKNQNGTNVTTELSSKSKRKAKKERLVHHSGMCQL